MPSSRRTTDDQLHHFIKFLQCFFFERGAMRIKLIQLHQMLNANRFDFFRGRQWTISRRRL